MFAQSGRTVIRTVRVSSDRFADNYFLFLILEKIWPPESDEESEQEDRINEPLDRVVRFLSTVLP